VEHSLQFQLQGDFSIRASDRLVSHDQPPFVKHTSWKTSRWKSSILSNGGWLVGDWGTCFLLNFLNKNVKMWSSDVQALVHTIVSVRDNDINEILLMCVSKPVKLNFLLEDTTRTYQLMAVMYHSAYQCCSWPKFCAIYDNRFKYFNTTFSNPNTQVHSRCYWCSQVPPMRLGGNRYRRLLEGQILLM